MEQKYSSQLMQKAKVAFEKRNGAPLSNEQVEEYLDKLSQFMFLFGEVMDKRKNENEIN